MIWRRLFQTLLVAALASIVGLLLWGRHQLEQRTLPREGPVAVSVADGEGLTAIAAKLHGLDLIRDPRVFRVLARIRGLDRQIRSGEYEIESGRRVSEVLDHLVRGPQRYPSIAIPEGLTVVEVAALLEEAGVANAAEVERLAADRAFVESTGLPERDLAQDHLEGFLFPDTYSFARGTSEKEILATMTQRFLEVFGPDLASEGEKHRLTARQAVTLASLIEKEAAVESERGTISAVFHNRLRRGMRLQSDPTAIYGVTDRSGPILRADLRRETPYNTYVIKGLPPGPIANPGRASLEAAVRPSAGVKALYFMARYDGTHEFNETLRGHNRAVRRYRKR